MPGFACLIDVLKWRVSSDGGEDEFIKRLRGAKMKDVKMCSFTSQE